MTALDDLLEDLSQELQVLGASDRAVFFRECGRGLRPLYTRWVEETCGVDGSIWLDWVEAAVEEYPTKVQSLFDTSSVLAELESRMPNGVAIDAVSSIGAQSCWISYDVALRSIVDPAFASELCIEYVLDPVLASVSERLFGFSQVGSGSDEALQVLAVVSDGRTQNAVRWIREALAVASVGGINVPDEQPHPLVPR